MAFLVLPLVAIFRSASLNSELFFRVFFFSWVAPVSVALTGSPAAPPPGQISLALLAELRLLKRSDGGSSVGLPGDRVLVSGCDTRHDVRLIRRLGGE